MASFREFKSSFATKHANRLYKLLYRFNTFTPCLWFFERNSYMDKIEIICSIFQDIPAKMIEAPLSHWEKFAMRNIIMTA